MTQTWRLMIGDVREQLRLLPDSSVHCVVTSPPYWGLRDYGTGRLEGGDADCSHTRNNPREDKSHDTYLVTRGNQAHGAAAATPYRDVCGRCGAVRIDDQIGLERTPWEFIAAMVDVFREVRRVLRDDGTCWLNLGDTYATGAGGVEHPGGGAQGLRWKGFRGDRTGHEGKHGYRPQTVGPMTQPNRLPIPGLKPKDLCLIPHRVAIALQEDGWWIRMDNVWAKPNPMPESVEDRPSKSHEYVFLLTKSERYFYDAEAVKEQVTGNAHHRGAGVHPKARLINANDRNGHRPRQNESFSAAVTALVASRNRRSVWSFTTQPFPGAHFATFPEELPETCIKAGTSEHGCCEACGAPYERVVELGEPLRDQQQACGGDEHGEYFGQAQKDYTGTGAQDPSAVKARILAGMRERKTVGWRPTCDCGAGVVPCTVADPFTGSGTTGDVALRLGRSFIGIELNEKYANELARPRLAAASPLFAQELVS